MILASMLSACVSIHLTLSASSLPISPKEVRNSQQGAGIDNWIKIL